MKKFMSILLSISFVFLLGCNNLNKIVKVETNKSGTESEQTSNKPSESASNTSENSIKNYYPFKENIKYEYEGKGNEFAEYTTWNEYIKEDRMQIRKSNGGTVVASVLENKNGELKIIFSKEEAYYREDFTSKESNKNEILLKEPLVKGTSWTLSDGRKRYISNVNMDITTPSGNYKALEVTTEGNNFKEFDYYVLNIGLIKSVYKADAMEVSSSLKKLSDNTPLVQKVNFYYPNKADEKIYFTQNDLSFKTNDITKMTFENMLKNPSNSKLGAVIGPNVKIKSLYLNNNIVYVDFSKELVKEMNAGSGYESILLQCIANTFGKYYNSDNVYITIEGEPYSSGHIAMKKGETFKVNLADTTEYKK